MLLTNTKHNYYLRSRRSPDRNNISKLNLFKNIFDDEFQKDIFNNKNFTLKWNQENPEDKIFAKIKNNKNQFYKLSDLVSFMVNDEYFETEIKTVCQKDYNIESIKFSYRKRAKLQMDNEIDEYFNRGYDEPCLLSSTPKKKRKF